MFSRWWGGHPMQVHKLTQGHILFYLIFFFFYLFMYMGILYAGIPGHHIHAWCLPKPEEGARSSGAGVLSSKWPNRCWELNPRSPLENYPVLLTSEPFVHNVPPSPSPKIFVCLFPCLSPGHEPVPGKVRFWGSASRI